MNDLTINIIRCKLKEKCYENPHYAYTEPLAAICMKQILVITILMTMYQISYSQTGKLVGHVKDRNSNNDFPYLEILLIRNDSVITGTVTNQEGNYEINNIRPGTYKIKLQLIGYRDRIIDDIIISSDQETKLNFIHPDTCIVSEPVCPINPSDKIIPIVYGLPDKKLIRKEKQGKVYIGGCVLTDCDPKWYCKNHDLKF